MRLVALLAVALFIGGCSFAPHERLTFPKAPVRTDGRVTWYDVNRDGRADFAIVLNNDGRIDQLMYDDDQDGLPERSYYLSDYANEDVPHVVILLDSIPYQTLADRYAAGDFRWFDPPMKMIAPFPSLTETCYSDIFNAPPLPAMIDNQYDPRLGEHRGDLFKRICGWEEPWERRLHYHAGYSGHTLSFLNPRDWYAGEMAHCYEAVEASPDRVTFVYTASAAGMLCKYGKQGADEVLDGAKQLCLQLLYEHHGAIKFSMMADHGHNYVRTKNVSLEKMVKDAGFNVVDKLAKPKDVVISINGLVTCAALHTLQPAQLVEKLVENDAIELAMFQLGDRVIIRGRDGMAAIESRGGKFRYVPIVGDLLNYHDVVTAMQSSGAADADGFANADAWEKATIDHQWPTAPQRVWDAFHRQMVSTPTVMLSIRDGYSTGKPELERYIDMESTHGGLNQVNCATFVMTMTGRLNGPVHHRDVLKQLEPGYTPRVLR
jgi:hypothetical protein